MSLLDGGGGSAPSNTDLLSDTLMMDDFAPDIDLLDDILGVDYDWKELEPTLSSQFQQQQQQQQQQQFHIFAGGQQQTMDLNLNMASIANIGLFQTDLKHQPLLTSQQQEQHGGQVQYISNPSTPLSLSQSQPSPPSLYEDHHGGGQDLKPLIVQGQVQAPSVVPLSTRALSPQGQSIIIPNFSALQSQSKATTSKIPNTTTQPQYIQPAPSITSTSVSRSSNGVEGSKILTQILPNPNIGGCNNGGNKVFSFATTGFCQPVFATSTNNGNGQTIILPQLQLALVQQQQQDHVIHHNVNGAGHQQDKLPMKRLATHSFSSSGSESNLPQSSSVTSGSKRSKGNKEQTTRRSSHNAIERRYRSSINDKIIELKSLVCHNSNDSDKVHKASILRNSIDTIRYLQNCNCRLEKENRSLKHVLNQVKKCCSCGADQPIAVFGSFAANSNADLRELLTDNSPPPTDHSSESSNPATPNSMIDEGQSPRSKANASPIALFAIAAGLFLINPGSHHPTHFEQDANGHGVHSRVERSVDYIPHPTVKPSLLDLWTPRLVALFVNLILFLAIWYLSGKLFSPRHVVGKSKKQLNKLFSKYSMDYVEAMNAKLRQALKLNSKSNSKEKLDSYESIIEEVTGEHLPTCNLALKFQNMYLLLKTPFLQSIEKSDADQQMDYIVGKCFDEIGKDGASSGNHKLADYCGLRSLEYGFNCVDTSQGQNLLISAVMLTKSKLVLKSLLMKIKSCKNITTKGKNMHPLLDAGIGLGFFRQNLNMSFNRVEDSNIGLEPQRLNALTTCIHPNDPVSRLVNKYKYEMMWNGVTQLFYYGSGAVDYFKNAVKGVISERKRNFTPNSKYDGHFNSVRNRRAMITHQSTSVDEGFDMETDLHCEWWACVLWSQAEWIARGGRAPVLQRLYKVVDSLWKYQMDDPLCKAVYYTHLAKRLLLKDTAPVPLNSVRRLVDSAGDGLRDAINLTTEKPKPVIQLIWTLTAEWILEIRLELWEEMNSATDVEFTRQFSRDLDTLRSLTHYVPSSLPSVYLYEASMRLMTKASPGRTQQLLDASLRSVRLNQRSGIICNNNNASQNLMNLEEDLLADKSTSLNSEGELNCNRMIKKNDRNLIREKRKAIALYLRCKHLPSQVMTCPGEKAGMLREALKCLELVGDNKKINECLDMMKSLHNVSLY